VITILGLNGSAGVNANLAARTGTAL